MAAHCRPYNDQKGACLTTTLPPSAQTDLSAENEALRRDLRAAQAALAERDHRLAHLVESVPHHLYMVEIDIERGTPRRIFASGRLAAMTGHSLDALAQAEPLPRDYVHPNDQPTLDAHLDRLMRGGVSAVEFRVTRADGGVIWLEDSARAQLHVGRGVCTIYGAMSDISDRKQYAAAQREGALLQIELNKARALSAMRAEFMSSVSHEFRTPLAMILSSAELMLRQNGDYPPEERARRLSAIIQHVRHLGHLLDDLSTIMVADAGQAAFNPRSVDLRALCAEIIEGLRAADSDAHPIALSIEGDGASAVNALPLDPKLVRHILTNLLGNALKYSPPGRDVMCALEVQPDYVVIHVADQGIGIPQAELDTIFEAFQRASNVGGIEGTGLGLKIVKDAVALHKGFINAQSAVGQGTLFSVTLPLLYNLLGRPDARLSE
jgi:PAS domain S-box-containing protein